ncbi:phage terminase large subunit [Nitrospinae bacterium AH_259_B05_G02_I21]|nr:phage terminase large subunit [Nitrospinae bacterium AH_259_B05_G02_I21]
MSTNLLHDILPARVERSPEAASRIARGLNDHGWWSHHYLPDYFNLASPPFHDEIVDDLARPPEAPSHDQLVIVRAAPREHAKSTLCTLSLPLHRACNGLAHFIVILSDTDTQARFFLWAIREELETNERLAEDYGDLVGGRKWTETEIILANNVKILARGAGAGMRGLRHGPHRPDLIVADDLENDENIASPLQRVKMARWFDRTLLNCLAPGGTMLVVGTVLHHDSLLSQLLKRGGDFKGKKYAAIQPDGTPLWPERWPIKRLEAKKRQIGIAAFDQEFQNEPIDSEARIFREETFAFYTTDDIVGKQLTPFAYIDLAISLRDTADYTAIVTIGVDEKGTIYVLDYTRRRMPIRAQVVAVFRAFDRWQHSKIGVEDVAYQRAFKQLLDEESAKTNRWIPTVGVRPDVDKVRRISTLSPLIERGDLLFRQEQTELIDELKYFPKASHDDLADALHGAVQIARQGAVGVIEYKSTGVKRLTASPAMKRF